MPYSVHTNAKCPDNTASHLQVDPPTNADRHASVPDTIGCGHHDPKLTRRCYDGLLQAYTYVVKNIRKASMEFPGEVQEVNKGRKQRNLVMLGQD